MPETVAGILALMLVLYLVLACAAYWIPQRSWVIMPLLACAALASLNAFSYTHWFDAAPTYYRYRTWILSDYVPALSGLCVGALILRTSGMIWLTVKAVAVGISLVLMLVPWAKPLINPVSDVAPGNVVRNGVISQSSASTCGPCAMSFTLSQLGCMVSEGDLAGESFTSGSGTELWYLARCAVRRGFRIAYAYDATTVPAGSIIGISLGETGHFVSVYQVEAERVWFHDSMRGRRVESRSKLFRSYRYSGLSLHIEASPGAGP